MIDPSTAAMGQEQQKSIYEVHGCPHGCGSMVKGFRFLGQHSQFFVSIQLMFMLPLAILVVIGEYFVYSTLCKAGLLNGSEKDDGSVGVAHLNLGMFIFVVATGGMPVFWAPFLSLPSAAILHLVGLDSAGKSESVSLMDGLRACVPRLWMRLSVINICKTSVLSSILVAVAGTLWGLEDFAFILLSVLMSTAIVVAICWLDVVFRPAAGVAVLEGERGRAAVKRSWELRKAGVDLVVIDQMLWWELVIFTFLPFQVTFRYLVASQGSCPWGLRISYTVVMSFVMLLEPLVQGFQYVSLKKFYEKAHPEHVYEELTPNGEHDERGGVERDDPWRQSREGYSSWSETP